MPAFPRQHTAMACSPRLRAAGENVLPVLFKPGEERRIAEQAIFGDFGIAGAKIALGQCVEHGGVGKHQHRLMKCADQILALGRIDPGLAADRGIDLGQQRRRHLHEVSPRRTQAAANPARSPITPPPSARMRSLRSTRASMIDLTDLLKCCVIFRTFARRHGNTRAINAGCLERGFSRPRDEVGQPSRRSRLPRARRAEAP